MEPIHIITLLITGIAVGFAQGLLGIGGCFIIVPVMVMVFTYIGIPMNVAVKLAFDKARIRLDILTCQHGNVLYGT